MSGWGLDPSGTIYTDVCVCVRGGYMVCHLHGDGGEGGEDVYMGVTGVGMDILCRRYRPGTMYVWTLLLTE